MVSAKHPMIWYRKSRRCVGIPKASVRLESLSWKYFCFCRLSPVWDGGQWPQWPDCRLPRSRSNRSSHCFNKLKKSKLKEWMIGDYVVNHQALDGYNKSERIFGWWMRDIVHFIFDIFCIEKSAWSLLESPVKMLRTLLGTSIWFSIW